MDKILVFTATYNEAGNIELLVDQIFRNLPEAHILVVDDGSPDGTGRILDRLSAANPALTVIHRARKLGLGSAHVLAMKHAIAHDYTKLVTMDADFSHNPKYLSDLLTAARDHDFVIGSRYVEGGKLDYGIVRQILSRTANLLTRLLLGIPLRETTTSYRCYGSDVLAKMPLDQIRSNGYSFFIECTYYVCRVASSPAEIPIHFENRLHGKSKISSGEIFKAVLTLLRLAWLNLLSSLGASRLATKTDT